MYAPVVGLENTFEIKIGVACDPAHHAYHTLSQHIDLMETEFHAKGSVIIYGRGEGRCKSENRVHSKRAPTQNIRLSISSQKVVSLMTLGFGFDGACFGNPKEQGRHPKVVKVVKKLSRKTAQR